MGTIALAHDLSSRHPFLINFRYSKLLLGAEVSFKRKLKLHPTSSVQWKRGRREKYPCFFFKEFLSDPS